MAKTNRGASRADDFPNFYKLAAVTSGADTLTNIEWNTGYSIKDGYGFVLHKIEWNLVSTDLANLNAANDAVYACLSTRNDLVDAAIRAGIADSIIDSKYDHLMLATAVGQALVDANRVHDFTNEPGGGRLVAPKPLYFNIMSTGAGVAGIGYNVKVIYTMIKLTEQVYRELYESMNPSA